MITRNEYLKNSSELHNRYYGQFVTKEVKHLILRKFGIDILVEAYNKDTNLNLIDLQLWDNLTCYIPGNIDAELKSVGDYPTLAGKVCILKAAAKMVVEALK